MVIYHYFKGFIKKLLIQLRLPCVNLPVYKLALFLKSSYTCIGIKMSLSQIMIRANRYSFFWPVYSILTIWIATLKIKSYLWCAFLEFPTLFYQSLSGQVTFILPIGQFCCSDVKFFLWRDKNVQMIKMCQNTNVTFILLLFFFKIVLAFLQYGMHFSGHLLQYFTSASPW